MWGATRTIYQHYKLGIFQSTHPVWGATGGQSGRNLAFSISIHAPRVGCDSPYGECLLCESYFNPRTPCGVRLWCIVWSFGFYGISIHAPRVGCDLCKLFVLLVLSISIHAPRVGCDSSIGRTHAIPNYFNPRTPCGVRPERGHNHASDLAFQSTHPVWGATRPRSISGHIIRYFNPRTPCGVRPR